MTAFLQISTNFSALDFPPQDCLRKQRLLGLKVSEPINIRSLSRRKIRLVCKYWLKTGVSERKLTFLRVNRIKDGTFIGEDGWKKSKRVVLVRFNGLGGGGGGGGGGGRRDNARVLGNLALAIGLIYLSVTGQLGWVLDAIVSVWLLAVLLPIVGLGAFLWWAGRDIVQGTCPNCGNVFQVFKSTLNDDLQLCPFCSQPFSVVGDKFVRDPVKFSNQSTTFEDAFNDFFPHAKKGKDSSVSVVDVEAEVKDAE
ncbi:uncharacterized protein [Coffea arabica]|uniref:Uncharacterized protein LOC113687943 n=1 Tax=Coffea arabica TaxID=13443 RepID=A0A6P6S563_COFAR|nr:uncharacterized protein LOC113687943 [Coffea arabica]XP_027061288.1 uncharacterized protein LOC113687943 [Coffea arabica]XP_027061289.1 uncharacterized protein LOC113687943 [Coffea arabica]